MAWFCLRTGFQPADYWDLKVEEYQAFLEVLEEMQK
jgi:hypothetical protein